MIVKEILNNKLSILCILAFVFLSCGVKKTSAEVGNVNLVHPKYKEITEILSSIYGEIENLFDDKKVFVINTDHINNKNTFRVTLANKSDFRYKLVKNNQIPFGYFLYNNIPVIVFGQNANEFFKNSKEHVFMEWLTPMPNLSDDKVIIPVNFEAPVWKYEYTDNHFVFQEVGF